MCPRHSLRASWCVRIASAEADPVSGAAQQAAGVIGRSGLEALIAGLAARGYTPIGPLVRDGAIVYEEMCATAHTASERVTRAELDVDLLPPRTHNRLPSPDLLFTTPAGRRGQEHHRGGRR